MPNYLTGYAPPPGMFASEAAARGSGPTTPYIPNTMLPLFNGTIGNNTVQLYGEGPALTQEQAQQRVLNQEGTQLSIRNGSMPVSQWQALNPGATAAELSAYKKLNEAYRAQTNGQGIVDRITNAAQFEVDRAGNLIKGVANNPGQLLTGGIDPIGTRIGNTLTGANNKPLVGQLGGATEDDFNRYESRNGFGSLGAARSGTASANYIAGMFGARGAANGLGNLFTSIGGATPMQTYQGAYNGLVSESGAGVGAGAQAALPEIVVEGTAQGGLSLGQIAAGAGVAGGAATALSGSGGSGSSGWSNNSDPVGSFGNAQTGGNAGQLANSGGIQGGAGAGSAGGGFGAGGNMGWGDWVNLGTQLYGAYAQGQGSKDASRAQLAASAAGIAEQRRQFDLSRSDQMPWLQSGQSALNRLNDPNGYQASPDYNYVRNEALRGVEGSAAAHGGLFSGNTARALQDRAAGVASQDYSNWFNRQASLAGLGQSSAQSLGGLGQNSANNIANLLGQQGDARASGIAGQTNALTGGLSDFLSWYNNRRGK